MTDARSRPLGGQNVLVTGASGAIGAAIVRQLAFEGAAPVIHYGRDRQAAQDLLATVGTPGWLVQGDLASVGGADAVWSDAVTQAGTVQGLVNCAGIRSTIHIEDDLTAWHEAWDREFRVNLFAAADLCRAAILHFRSIGGGRIINVASRAGQRGYSADAFPYGATKAALINLTKSIARSFAGEGITAVAVAPGFVSGPMADAFIAAHGEATALADNPLRAMATPNEIAEIVAFALRPTQRSLNGATLDVNGGSYTR